MITIFLSYPKINDIKQFLLEISIYHVIINLVQLQIFFFILFSPFFMNKNNKIRSGIR